MIWNFGSTEMPIPTREDYLIAEIDNAASNILNQLRILRRSKIARDQDRLRAGLRQSLQDYNDMIVDLMNAP